jgi:predicted RND superfamily exporter protein
MVFGFMGIVGVPLDAVTVGLGSTALGIAVDDTIHVVSGYRRGMQSGGDALEAVNASFGRVLPPLVYTTIAIAIGFGVLSLSNFTVTRNLGLVTSGVVVLCLLADLTLLPALLVVRRKTLQYVIRGSPADRAAGGKTH